MKKVVLVVLFVLISVSAFGQTTISMDGTFRVMEVREYTSTDRFRTPGEGMRFVAFDIIVDRRGNTGFAFDIRVRDSDFRVYRPNAMSSTLKQPSLPSRVDDDDIVRGWLVIAIPTNIPIVGLQIRLAQLFRDNITDWLTLE